MKLNCNVFKLVVFGILLITTNALAQEVTIKEEILSLPTYGFHKPNPVPILTENPKIFPYFKFEEYEHDSKMKDWKVITLENDYIKVYILPEIGGKIWGAIEKSTGEEFLYKNEVVKFRNIAMRGPWTSGGIEFNFGIIGHHPATATTVDYLTRTNADGSVSCIVGNTDLPSKTRWTVEIRLEKDKAFFETNASWYNASPLTENYYNWMTGAAVGTNDLEFFIPGNKYVGHSGDAHPWPIDEEGRNLAMYKDNDFGPDKSYHIVGESNDYFGGYYHDKNFGFGTWAPYEEMPGQKLWIWSLSRSGGIWEDLLTDNDGQYIEFQAGRLFDQYTPGKVNPISQVGFDPYVMDTWSEIWFPYKEIGGMEDASKQGVLNVEFKDGTATIGLNVLQKTTQELQLKLNNEIVFSERLNLNTMDVYTKKLPVKSTDKFEVAVLGTELYYTNTLGANSIKRPFYPDADLKVSETEQLFQDGVEALEYREYVLAESKLSELIKIDPSHRAGLNALAELEYRKTNYKAALNLANSVLKMDTYNSGANYIAGITYKATDDSLNAIESLGWAARDIKYRSVAYATMAEIYLKQKNYDRAKMYAAKALTFNLYNVNAREVLLVLARINNDSETFKSYTDAFNQVDPLNRFVKLEKARFDNFNEPMDSLKTKKVLNEFEKETILSSAIRYHELGFDTEALLALLSNKTNVKNSIWAAYLQKDSNKNESARLMNEAISARPNLVFPYRRETIPVLEWAVSNYDSWKLKYYLSQNYLAVGLRDKGETLLKELGDIPDSDIVYRFRATLLKDSSFESRAKDYEKALKLAASDWKVWEENIIFQGDNKKYDEAYALSKKAFKKFKGNYNIELAHAKALLNTGRFSEVIKVLKNIQVLPFEHASESRKIYERAHLSVAQKLIAGKKYKSAISILNESKKWPENIGVGKPHTPDERIQDYLLAICFEALEENSKKSELLQNIVDYTNDNIANSDVDHLFGLLALKKLNKVDALSETVSKLKNESAKNQLALSLFNNELDAAQELKQENHLTDDIWQVLISAIKY
ncbi:DUF5107 domain-containing protein [Aurantibacter crassamenti]|uniref:DUF5107 domain-containing protein n=1 Tax=Aurantibacter crassamenti TaxID=1837375 RepID=UPI00193AC818|nr:DUF5107 domain-containing protein [Aurantibacter crassamenti]MBM1106854.1 DUF5107 domain-containing protein [Aurantibacter crassamenti]